MGRINISRSVHFKQLKVKPNELRKIVNFIDKYTLVAIKMHGVL